MTISELIVELQKMQEQYGDAPVGFQYWVYDKGWEIDMVNCVSWGGTAIVLS